MVTDTALAITMAIVGNCFLHGESAGTRTKAAKGEWQDTARCSEHRTGSGEQASHRVNG